MARKVFFSFKYEDVSRSMVVRNSWVTHGGQTAAGFIDSAEFEKVKREGDRAIQNWIDSQLHGTSVTAVLVGKNTFRSKWVQYEIQKSIERNNGVLAIDISKIKDLQGETTERGSWPTSEEYKRYLWNKNEGYKNLSDWVELAAKQAEKVL